MSEFKRIVNVVPLTRIKLAGPQIFTYEVPVSYFDQIRPGLLVEVPFGGRVVRAVTSTFEMRRLPVEVRNLKSLKKILDPVPVLTQKSLALAEWLASYYFVSLGLALKLMVPKTVKNQKKPEIVGFETFNPDFVLTEHQRQAVAQIGNALNKNKTFLLKGVTGSGKTEVYMQVIERLMRSGKQVIILVPEISLTAQALERYGRRFGVDQIAVLHSRLADSERLWTWRQIRTGEKKIIIGPRSAVFAPVKDLGLIVLDEEHDQSFKQFDQVPKYHARTVAEKLSELWQCPLILGDATPAVETYYRALQEEISLLELPHRIKADQSMPKVQVIDMRPERTAGFFEIMSEYLKLAVLEALRSKKQIILFLNRRGLAPVVMCKDCGHAPLCLDCATSLVWHKAAGNGGGVLLCHHCGRKYPLPDVCTSCGGARFGFWGIGTQAVEDYLKEFLKREVGANHMPEIVRMDQDTTRRRGSQEQFYKDWAAGKIQILIGTQIITKGWDLSGVGLVGIVSGDNALHLPDFRSNERTFQVLTQVAGRTGRGQEPGLVVLQTLLPENYAIGSVKTHNYEKFFEAEIAFRKKYGYPPFKRLFKLTISAVTEKKAEAKAENVFQELFSSRTEPFEILGPTRAYIYKIRKKYRMQIFLKLDAIGPNLKNFLINLPADVDIDVDPESLL